LANLVLIYFRNFVGKFSLKTQPKIAAVPRCLSLHNVTKKHDYFPW